jgi:hypothetical protein
MCFAVSGWLAMERTCSGPKTRRKTPATIEELRFTYPNIRDSQPTRARGQGAQNRRRFKAPGAGQEPSPRRRQHAINLLKFASNQQLIATGGRKIR